MVDAQLRLNLCTQLAHRNATQTAPFRDVFEKYQKQVKEKTALAEKVATLESSLTVSQQRVLHLESELNYTREQYHTGTYSQTKLMALEAKLSSSQETQNEVLQKLNDQTQKCLTLMESNEKYKSENDALKTDMQGLKEDGARKAKIISEMEKKIRELETVITVLTDDAKELRHLLLKRDESIKQHELEKTHMVEQLLQLKHIQIEAMNRENLLIEEAIGTGSAAPSNTNPPASYPLAEESMPVPSKIKKIINNAHQDEINTIAFNNNGMMFASGSLDKSVRLWDTKTGNRVASFGGPVQGVMCVQFSETDDSILGTSNENSIRVWSTQQQRLKHTLTGHTSKVYSAKFCTDGQKIVSGSHDRTMRIWDLNKGYCVKTMFCTSSCNDLDVSRDGYTIVSGHFDNQIRIIDVRSGDICHEIATAHTSQVTSVEISKDGSFILTNSRDNTIKLIDFRNWHVVKNFRHEGYRNGLNWTKSSMSRDGRYIAAGSHDGAVFIWDAKTEAVDKILRNGHKCVVPSVSWHPNGSQLISCDKDKNIIIWS